MKVEARDTVYCPFCGQEAVLDGEYCDHVQYIYRWSSVDPDGYIFIRPEFFTIRLKLKISAERYRRLFARLSVDEQATFLKAQFEPMAGIAMKVNYCGDKADVTFSVIQGAGYSGIYVGFSKM
mgnify:CR=1 FL=1